MPTALSGSLGWTGVHPLQLGGPPLVSTWSRPIAGQALPLIAHVYANDGVTAKGTFKVLNRPAIKSTLANGGLDQITLEVPQQSIAAIWGQFIWGTVPWGGKTIQGDVIRLTEEGGPWPGFIYGGVIESLPDTRSATGTKHEIVVSPFGWELTRVGTQLVYTTPTDVIQTVRDAVALTQHCSCDQVSVPVSTGVMIAQAGAVDYRGQKVTQVLDTARSILGPTWVWHCDELGRVWMYPQGSGAVYTLLGGAHYEERTTNGGDIQDRMNQVIAVGGVPAGGSANVQAVVPPLGTLSPSQQQFGIRTLDPPVSVPNITDQATLSLIANGVLATLDQTWIRVQIKALPKFTQRIHASQPGGAMLRYFEEVANPLPESGQGLGYVGPFITQAVTYDGLRQEIEAGSIPVTNQADVDNLVQSLVSRAALNSLQVTAAALNLNQTLTGSFQSGTGTLVNGQRATLWSLGQQEFAAIDPNAITRAEMGNLAANGISPAQWGFRANDSRGIPIFDSEGLIAVMQQLGQVQGGGTQNISSLSDVLLNDGSGHQATITFTLARQARVKVEATVTSLVSTSSVAGSGNATITATVDGVDQEGVGLLNPISVQSPAPGPATGVAYTAPLLWSEPLAAGPHTIAVVGATQDLNTTLTVLSWSFWVFLLGS